MVCVSVCVCVRERETVFSFTVFTLSLKQQLEKWSLEWRNVGNKIFRSATRVFFPLNYPTFLQIKHSLGSVHDMAEA